MVWSTLSNHPLFSLQWGAVVVASLIAAGIDLQCRRIPNWLTASMFVSGLVWAICTAGMRGAGDSLAAAVLMAFPYIVLFVIAGGGAADAKIMGALGAWLGLANGCAALVAVCIAGAVLGMGYAVLKRQFVNVTTNMVLISSGILAFVSGQQKWAETSQQLPDTKHMLKIPYGVAVCTGVLLTAATLGIRKRWLGV